MLKCQFHTHVSGDPVDHISYDAKTLINKASELNYDVLSITSHRKIIFNKHLKKYAEKNKILLIPGIELEINKKHILIINTDEEIEKVSTFEELRFYKKSHQNCLIIAPHPFFPGEISLKRDLINNIDIFDAIEYSFCYTKTKNYNLQAEALAKRWKKQLIATSDCHTLKYLDLGYAIIDAQKNTMAVINAIKKNKITNITSPISYFKVGKIVSLQFLRNLIKPH